MAPYRIVEHTIPGQHIREYPHATRSEQGACINLAVKQYVPVYDQGPSPGDVTIITGHANGFPKEMYEPLWDHLIQRSGLSDLRIRSIVCVDRSNQAASGVLNEQVQGDDPCWFDHSRDLLVVINKLRPPRPIVGVGHSMGATELVNLSIIHPRLFSSLILIEPIIMNDIPPGPNIAMASTLRQDYWPDRKAAEHAIRKNKLFQSFQPQVLKKYMEYGLRNLPTAVYPDVPLDEDIGRHSPVTLTTTKHQEVWTFARSNFSPRGHTREEDRVINPNADPETEMEFLFHRPECTITFNNLPHVRPTTYFIFGGKSPFSPPKARLDKERLTGTGIGGNGGVEAGKVNSYVFKDGGHFMPFVNVEDLANVVHNQLSEGLRQAQEEDALWERHDSQKSERDRLVVSKTWREQVKKPADAKRPIANKL